MTLKLNRAALNGELKRMLEPRAHAAGAQLVEDLSHEGSGTHWPDNPRRSSAIGEMPAPQSEHLMQSIDVKPGAGLAYRVGSFAGRDAEGFQHAEELMTRPPEQGGRDFLGMELDNPAFHRAILTGKVTP